MLAHSPLEPAVPYSSEALLTYLGSSFRELRTYEERRVILARMERIKTLVKASSARFGDSAILLSEADLKRILYDFSDDACKAFEQSILTIKAQREARIALFYQSGKEINARKKRFEDDLHIFSQEEACAHDSRLRSLLKSTAIGQQLLEWADRNAIHIEYAEWRNGGHHREDAHAGQADGDRNKVQVVVRDDGTCFDACTLLHELRHVWQRKHAAAFYKKNPRILGYDFLVSRILEIDTRIFEDLFMDQLAKAHPSFPYLQANPSAQFVAASREIACAMRTPALAALYAETFAHYARDSINILGGFYDRTEVSYGLFEAVRNGTWGEAETARHPLLERSALIPLFCWPNGERMGLFGQEIERIRNACIRGFTAVDISSIEALFRPRRLFRIRQPLSYAV